MATVHVNILIALIPQQKNGMSKPFLFSALISLKSKCKCENWYCRKVLRTANLNKNSYLLCNKDCTYTHFEIEAKVTLKVACPGLSVVTSIWHFKWRPHISNSHYNPRTMTHTLSLHSTLIYIMASSSRKAMVGTKLNP